jgi:mycofactocin system FadH/OYE family oxidoreductase 1
VTTSIVDGVRMGKVDAPSRVLFGPHVTNLCDGRALSERHVAYYERRARGGCGVIVTETASVHVSDWPYERAPLAADSREGFSQIAAGCAPHGTVILAGLGHAGMQGSTTWSQDVLWAPSLVPNVATHEQPIAMGRSELAELVAGFTDAAHVAMAAGLQGVEVNAGQHSLLRQFCSGLTNLRGDDYGEDRTRLLRDVLAAVRTAVGGGVVGVRFCVDELAPWAGITPELAAGLLAEAMGGVDYVVFVRGSIYSEAATQPDGQVEQAFNLGVLERLGPALRERHAGLLLCLQGSVVDVDVADRALSSGACDLVEMTRAQLADPDLCAKARRAEASRIRPCILCNQHCCVRDVRNPIVSCTVNPIAGHELDDAALDVDELPAASGIGTGALVVGGGIAGMEVARLLARRGHQVHLCERTSSLGGMLRPAASLPGRARLGALSDWLERELVAEGVRVELGRAVASQEATGLVVVATGAAGPMLELPDGNDGSVDLVDAADVALGAPLKGDVVVLDPIGGPVGVGVAELAAATASSVVLVTPDVVAASQLSLTGDLVAANERLARARVVVRTHSQAVSIHGGTVVLEDRFTAARVQLAASVCVDAGHRCPSPQTWPDAARRVGDAVAPRGIGPAMLEARRAALEVEGSSQ